MHELDDTKARLLDAAGEEFADKGFQGATIRSIVRRAGANVAAAHYHFGDKEQLYTQAVLKAHRYCVRTEAPDGPPPEAPAEALRVEVRHFLENVFAVDRTEDWHHTLLMREMIRPSHASETLVREVIRPKFGRLRDAVRRLRPDLDDRELDASVFSVVGQCLFYRLGRAFAQRLIGHERFAALDVEYLTGHITAFTLQALGRPGERGSEPASAHTHGEGPSCPGSP